MRNPLIYRLSNESGEYAVRTRFVEVFNNTGGGNLSYAGDYFGVYTLMEKIKRDEDRGSTSPRSVPRDTAEPEVTGGLHVQGRTDPRPRRTRGIHEVNTSGHPSPGSSPKEDEVVPAQQTWLVEPPQRVRRAPSTPTGHRSNGKHSPTTSTRAPGSATTGSTPSP